jgi:hypothetical protein
MKVTVFWDVAPYSVVETDRHFKELAASIIRVMTRRRMNKMQTT